jgi:nitroreductase
MPPFDLSQTDHLLTTTRAVRKRLDFTRPVERKDVLDALRVALQAPTGGNTQRWRWLIVDDPETRNRLAEVYRSCFEPYIQEQRELDISRSTGDEKVIDSSQYLSDHLHEVPMLVIPVALGRLPADAPTYATAEFYGSILPAAWNLMLALRSRGLGSAWTTVHLRREAEAAAILGLPDTVTQVAMLPVAYYTGVDFKPGIRRPVEEVTYWNGWKQSIDT